MKIPNNQKEIANKIDNLNLKGVSATYDDGNVGVTVEGSEEVVAIVAKHINEAVGHYRIGDGVQEGDIYINKVELSQLV